MKTHVLRVTFRSDIKVHGVCSCGQWKSGAQSGKYEVRKAHRAHTAEVQR